MDVSETRFERVGAVLGWGLAPAILAMQFANLRRGVFVARDDVLSWELALYAAVIIACLPWTIRALRGLLRPARLAIMAFIVVTGYALVSSLVAQRPMMLGLSIERIYLAMPNIAAIMALAAGCSVVAAMPARWRRSQLWVCSWVLVATSYLSWPSHIADLGSMRLSPGMGGAAVIYMALLPAFAVLLSCALDGHHRLFSAIGAGLAGVAIVLSGSRAGLLCFALFLGAVLVGQIRRGTLPGWVKVAGAAGGAVLAAVIAFVPEGRRLLSTTDVLREINVTAAWRAWTQSWSTVVFGQGSGRVWPWYSFEAGFFGKMPRLVHTQWGDALPHPHSTVLMVAVELGVVGLVLLACFFGALIWAFVRTRAWGKATFLVVASIVAGLPGLLFDTFLFKNLTIAFWWWAVLISVVGFGSLAHRQPADDQPSAASVAS